MNRESTRKRRVQKTLGLHYSRFYVIALCIDSRFRHKILENCSQAAPVEKVGLADALVEAPSCFSAEKAVGVRIWLLILATMVRSARCRRGPCARRGHSGMPS